MRIYHVSGILLNALLVYFSQQSYGIDNILLPILEMRKWGPGLLNNFPVKTKNFYNMWSLSTLWIHPSV